MSPVCHGKGVLCNMVMEIGALRQLIKSNEMFFNDEISLRTFLS